MGAPEKLCLGAPVLYGVLPCDTVFLPTMAFMCNVLIEEENRPIADANYGL